MRGLVVLLALSLDTISAEAQASAACAQWRGKQPTLATFAVLESQLPPAAAKGEFETTVQYEARIKRPESDSLFVLETRPEEREQLVFDADSGTLTVQSWFFSNTRVSTRDALESVGLKSAVGWRPGWSEVAVLASLREERGKQYEAQNAYGARVLVTPVTRFWTAVFDRPATSSSDGLFGSETVLDVMRLSPDSARAVKLGARTAVVFSPRAPWSARGSIDTGSATTSDPTERREEFRVLIGDITCALLLSRDGVVLGAYPTR